MDDWLSMILNNATSMFKWCFKADKNLQYIGKMHIQQLNLKMAKQKFSLQLS